MSHPRVSVVVPARSRPNSLARCLAALRKQTIAHELEIIVVQDGFDVDLSAAVDGGTVRLVSQPRAGPGAARNRGASEARATLLCFTDDDCEPAPDWAEHLAVALERGVPAVLGRTVNADPHDRLGATSQLVVNALADHSRARGAPFGPSSNFACRRDIFRAVPFDQAYRFAGGDRDWCSRMRAAGYELGWEPAAVVRHRQELTSGRFLRQHVAWGRGSYRFRRRRGSAFRLERPAFYLRLVRDAGNEGKEVSALTVLSQLATAAGYLWESFAVLTAAKSTSSRDSERVSVSSRATRA